MMGKDELKACPIHEGECLTHWNIIKHDHDLFQGECRTDCGLVYLTAHKDFYEDAKRSLFSVWNTRPNDAKKWIRVEDELPETGQIVIAFEPHCLNNPDMGMTLVVVDDTFHEVKRHDGKPWVTHWMPAITPPKQSSEGEE